MLNSKRFRQVLDRASREVDTMAVWRSLSIEDKEKALRLLLGRNWRWFSKATIENYCNELDARGR